MVLDQMDLSMFIFPLSPQAFALWSLIPEPFLTGCLSPVAHAGGFPEWKLVRERDSLVPAP